MWFLEVIFKKILPIIPKGSRDELVMSTINSSRLWKFCKVLTSYKNMRLLNRPTSYQSDDVMKFAKWVLDVGNGKLSKEMDGRLKLIFQIFH